MWFSPHDLEGAKQAQRTAQPERGRASASKCPGGPHPKFLSLRKRETTPATEPGVGARHALPLQNAPLPEMRATGNDRILMR